MLLIINIGNSEIKIGISQKEKWLYLWRFPTHPKHFVDYYSLIGQKLEEGVIDKKEIEQIIISSVVPSLTIKLESSLKLLFQKTPIVLGPAIYKKLPIPILNPHEIGTDLVANALAAYHRFAKDCIVVDFGTALTFITIKGNGEILGVAIAPGIKTAIKALAGSTAQLSEVPIEVPDSALGKNTIHAIQAGTLVGYIGMVKEVVGKIRTEVGAHFIAVATGGLSFALPELEHFFEERDRQLTLDGIRKVLDYI